MNLSKLKFDFGSIPLSGVYKDHIEILGGIEDFHYISGSCGCTKVSLKENKILLEFTPEKSIGQLKKGQTMFKPVYVNLYLDKEKPEFISDDDGRRILNPDKTKIVLPINYLAVG